jgi:hypothetical protein
MEAVALFRSLRRPSNEEAAGTFAVARLGYAEHLLGKDANGAPALLLRVSATATLPPIVLQHVTVQHAVSCRVVSAANAPVEDKFSIVRCTSSEPALREYFVRVIASTVDELGATPTGANVNRAFSRLIELFRAFQLPARRTAQGLWAELLLLAYSSDPVVVARAWQSDPGEGFDFSEGSRRVEVKSVAGDARIHSFSLRQLRPGPGVDVLIASIHAERSAGGLTISELLEQIRSRALPTDLVAKVADVVARSLGDSAASGLALRFDIDRGRSSLRFFDARRIPSIEPPLPAGILSVNFEALLDETKATQISELGARETFFSAFVPIG